MTTLPFIKMHGAGNDYVFVDGFKTDVPADLSKLAIQVSDRNTGIGSDGLVLMGPPTNGDADVAMRMWNADGSEGSMCGNAARCIALWLELHNRATGRCVIETTTRIVTATTIHLDRSLRRGEFCVDLGEPEFDSAEPDKLQTLIDIVVPGWELAELPFVSVSIGNPHAVFFVEELTDRLVRNAGSVIEKHKRFPDGTNVEWVQLANQNQINVRVWERGSGETLACGSGACAAAVASIVVGKCRRDRDVEVRMPGGNLKVEWAESGNVLLSGPAAVSFVGDYFGGLSPSRMPV